jgi:hypothetical protein
LTDEYNRYEMPEPVELYGTPIDTEKEFQHFHKEVAI